MTSNGDPVLNASSTTATNHDDRPKSPPSSKAASPSSKENRPLPQNGHHDHDDAQNESEAETVVLDRDSPKKKLIKMESHDDDDNVAHLRSIREETARAHSNERNGRRRSSVVSHVNTNGAKHGSDRDAKSPVPTSPSSRTTSRHTKDTSPTDSTKSPVQSAHSPTQTLTRGRSASTVENRKRKLRDESFPKSIEPPRQKAKTEGLKDARLPHPPGTPGTARPHKRSQSTQSALTGLPGRKRREITALAPLSTDRWSDDSSENSSSPRPAQTPSLLQHARVKRSSHRALTSPARTMPKSKTDRFGATRLARESEKGDLDAVKEAFEEAPEELNQVDYAGIAPLQKAALQGHADVVHYLISKGCNTKCESNDRDTPLIDAVENGHLEVVKLLLNEGRVNPHHANKKGQRAIDVLDVEDEDHDEIEKVLKDAMRRETNTSTNDKHEPSERKQAKSASRLLYNEFNVETLIEKAGDGDILAVGELINSNIKPNITCGVAAARGGHYDILSILLASGLKADPDPSKHPETPMTVAIERGHLKIIQLLLEQDNFDPTRRNKEGKTYYELAEEKAGPRWEQERDVLKQAYDEHKGMHRSPRRAKKEPPNLSTVRLKRKISPKRDRSSSPRLDTKRSSSSKSTPVSAAAPQKSRRLMSGKEKASREGQRHKRVVDDESSDDQSEDDVRPPRKVKPRSYSLGQEGKPVKKPLKARSDDNDNVPRKALNRSDESESDHGSKPPPKIRKRIEKASSAKPTLEVDSPDERKTIKSKIKYKTMDDKIRKRKHSDASADEVSVRKTPTISAKSTPAPPERTGTPEAVRERRQEEQRLEAEARKRAAEAAEAEAEAQRKEEEEAARKAAEEEAKKKADAEAEAQRQAAEAEAARIREAEEAQRRAEEEERCRQEMLAARQERLSMLPKALRRACELGDDRPLHFQGEELGISTVFLPLYYAEAAEIDSPQALPDTSYVCSFQVVGILGLPELDLARLDAPYSTWPRIPLTRKQREAIMQTYDTALLAQDYRFPMEGTRDFDFSKITASVKEAKSQFLAMDGLYWIEEKTLCEEMSKREKLQPLLATLGPRRCRIRFPTPSPQPGEVRKKKPRRSFVDLIKAQNAKKVNGVVEAGVNGAA